MMVALKNAPPPPPYQFNQPSPPSKRKIGCWGWAAIILIGVPALTLLNPNNYKPIKEEAPTSGANAPTPKPSAPIKPVMDDRTDVGAQIKVLDAKVYWKVGAGNPSGPKMIWVKPKIKNDSKVHVGVVYATIKIRTLEGHAIDVPSEDIVFLAESGIRGKLAPGKTYWGDKEDEGDPYPPITADGSIITEQPVKVEVSIMSAFANPKTGHDGKPLE